MITRFTWHNNMNFKTAMDKSIELQGDPGPRGFQGEQGISGENASTLYLKCYLCTCLIQRICI